MISESTILKALSQIIDPRTQKDIVTLGLVKNLTIKGSKVTFDVDADFKKPAEDAVMVLDGVQVLKVNPITNAVQPQNILKDIKSIIAVSSCKGGVGKSTVAVHLAMELARDGAKVGLVDVDIHGPSIPTLLNLQGTQIYSNEQKLLIPVEKNNVKVMSFGFLLGDAPAVMRGPMVARYVQQILLGTDWGELDYLLIDMPPGTGDVQLTITQSLQLSGAIIVTTPQTLSLVDVARGILMFEKVDVPILGIIENMSYFICDECHKKHTIFGEGGAQTLQERFGVQTLGEIPLLPQFTHNIEKTFGNDFIISMGDNVRNSLKSLKSANQDLPHVTFNEKYVILKWADNSELVVKNKDLRLSCRCALCVNEMTGAQILDESKVRDDIAPTQILPLGNYALGINWNDGHTSGIYPYNTIKEIAGVAK